MGIIRIITGIYVLICILAMVVVCITCFVAPAVNQWIDDIKRSFIRWRERRSSKKRR